MTSLGPRPHDGTFREGRAPSHPSQVAEIEAPARQGVARVTVPVSSAAGLPAQVKTPGDVLRYGNVVIARFR